MPAPQGGAQLRVEASGPARARAQPGEWPGTCSVWLQKRAALPLLNPMTYNMTAEGLVGLIEEMIDLKLQRYAAANLKLSPEVARLMQEKHETDRRRLEQVRAQLVSFLKS